MTLGSSPIAALISLRLVISLSMDSSFFRVTKLAAGREVIQLLGGEGGPVLATEELDGAH